MNVYSYHATSIAFTMSNQNVTGRAGGCWLVGAAFMRGFMQNTDIYNRFA